MSDRADAEFLMDIQEAIGRILRYTADITTTFIIRAAVGIGAEDHHLIRFLVDKQIDDLLSDFLKIGHVFRIVHLTPGLGGIGAQPLP